MNTEPIQISASLEGKLLVATPYLNGSIFEKALIFIWAHDSNGALGSVINKHLGMLSLEQACKMLRIKKNPRAQKKYIVHYGGPVQENDFFVLSATREQKIMFEKNKNATLYSNAEEFLKDIIKGKQKDDFLIMKGFCGWAPNQLEEIKENSWVLTNVDYKTLFGKKSSSLWEKTVKPMGINDFDKIVSYTGIA